MDGTHFFGLTAEQIVGKAKDTAYITIDDKSLEKLDGLLKDAESKLDYSKIK